MLPEEWPVAASAADRREPVRGAGRERLPTVRRDLFLDDRDRLTEQERALMVAMLDCLIGELADELESELPAGWVGANDDDRHRLVATMKAGGLLDEEGLVALLLRRAEEERASVAVRTRTNRRESRFLQSLVSHDKGPIAAAAMALVLARGRRRDRLGQCLVTMDDLDPSTVKVVAARVAATLRGGLVAAHGAGATDEALAQAVAAVLARHDFARGVDALTADLITALGGAGHLDDALLLGAAAEGESAFLAHALGHRASIDPLVAMEELLSGEASRVMALLRMGGASRDLAAGLLAGSGDWIGLDDDGRAIDVFDQMPAGEVEAARAWLLANPDYRAAVGALGRRHG